MVALHRGTTGDERRKADESRDGSHDAPEDAAGGPRDRRHAVGVGRVDVLALRDQVRDDGRVGELRRQVETPATWGDGTRSANQRRLDRLIDETTDQWMNQTTDQSMKKLMNQLIGRSIDESINQPINR